MLTKLFFKSAINVNNIMRFVIGLVLVALIAVISVEISSSNWVSKTGFGALTLAIIIGFIIGNLGYHKLTPYCDLGVLFSKHYLLRLGIILYGFKLTFQQIADVGTVAIVTDFLTLTLTFLLTCWCGRRFFALDRETTLLIGAGSSICGAAAILATEPVVKAESNKVTVAVSTVVIFGTIAIFVYPYLFILLQHITHGALSEHNFGIYIGSTVHEVAQVAAAGQSISSATSDTAVITKMIRVILLAPFLLFLSLYLSRSNITTGSTNKAIIAIPWFAIVFILVSGFNSFHLLPIALVQFLIKLDTLLLSMAMAALGLLTQLKTLRKTGLKPLLLAGVIFIWLIVGGGLINLLTESVFSYFS